MEKCPFKIRADGTAEDLEFFPDGTGTFRLDYARAGNISDPRDRPNPERAAILNRLKAHAENTPAGRAADLISTRQLDDAFNLLSPLTRSPHPDFVVLANFAHLQAVRRQWAEAIKWHESAMEDAEFPDELAGTTPQQRAWLKRVEKDYYRRWLKVHNEESRKIVPPNLEGVFPLFPDEPPSDAIAIVQQLLLWMPEDNRLYWLLAELYLKRGRPHQAKYIFDSLASFDRQYANRTLMMDHRDAASKAAAATPLEEPELAGPPADSRPWYEQLGLSFLQLIGGISAFAAMAAVLLYLQFRKILRRSRRRQ